MADRIRPLRAFPSFTGSHAATICTSGIARIRIISLNPLVSIVRTYPLGSFKSKISLTWPPEALPVERHREHHDRLPRFDRVPCPGLAAHEREAKFRIMDF